MSPRLTNILAASSLAIVLLTFELGGISPANAFFYAGAVLTFYTAYQFLRHDGATLQDAAKAIFVRPAGGGQKMRTYVTYVSCTVVGIFVAVQAISTSI